MNHFLFFDADVATRVCLTLAHSLWQFGLLALLPWLVARWLKRSSQQYLVHVAALLTGLLLLPATFAVIDVPRLAPDEVDVEEVVGIDVPSPGSLEAAQAVYPAKPAGEFASAEQLELETRAPFQESPPDESMAKLGNPRAEVAWLQWFTKVAPWLLGGYVLGVVVMLARLLRAYWSAGRLAKCGEIISEGELHAFLSQLSGQWRLRAVPVLKQVETLVVPKVVGLLRPTILLPAGALSGLTTEELEMILAHELAHVRRADLWVNLVQRIAEAVLFFNPPLWLLNRRISTLREYCCDELACGAASQRTSRPQLQYALALLQVVELKQDADFARTEQVAALAASGRSPSELRRRIARLFDEPLREPLPLGRGGVWTLLALGALLVTGSLVWAERGVESASAEPQQQKFIRTIAGGTVELIAIGKYSQRANETHWWRPDGSWFTDFPYSASLGRSYPADETLTKREFLYRVIGLNEQQYGITVTPSLKSHGGLVRDKDESELKNYRLVSAYYKKEKMPKVAAVVVTAGSHAEAIENLPLEGEGKRPIEKKATLSGKIVLEDGSLAKVKGQLYYNVRYSNGNSAAGTGAEFIDEFKFSTKAGTVYLTYYAPGYAPVWTEKLILAPGEQRNDLRLVLRKGVSQRVRVVDEQGEPIAGAKLLAHPEIHGQTGGPNYEKKTDQQGEYHFEHLADTKYDFRVEAPGFEPLRDEPRLLQPHPGETMRLTMTRAAKTQGIVQRAADLEPLAGARIYLNAEIRQPNHSSSGGGDYGELIATTDGQGRFTLDQLARNSHHLLVVEAKDGARAIVHEVPVGGNLQVVMPERRDFKVTIRGDLSQLYQRRGKPFVKVMQRTQFQPIGDFSFGSLISKSLSIRPNQGGGTATLRGLAVDLKPDDQPQEVEVELLLANEERVTKKVEMNAEGVTEVEFVLSGAEKEPRAANPKTQATKSKLERLKHDLNIFQVERTQIERTLVTSEQRLSEYDSAPMTKGPALQVHWVKEPFAGMLQPEPPAAEPPATNEESKAEERLKELREAVSKTERAAQAAFSDMQAKLDVMQSKPVAIAQLEGDRRRWNEASRPWADAKAEYARAKAKLKGETPKALVVDERKLVQGDLHDLADHPLPPVPKGAVRLTVPFAGIAGDVVDVKTLSRIQPGKRWLEKHGTRWSEGGVPVVLDYMPPAEVPLRGVENFHAWIEERGRGDFINGMFMGQGPVAVRGAKLMRLRVRSWEETTQVTRENLLKQFKDVKPGEFIHVGSPPKNSRSFSCFAVLTKEGELAVGRVVRVDYDKKAEMLIDLMKISAVPAAKPTAEGRVKADAASEATLAPQREVVTSLEELYKHTKALYEEGSVGGEFHNLKFVAYELATAKAKLAHAEGKIEAAVEYRRAAFKAVEEHVEASQAMFDAGQVKLAEKVDSIKLRAKAKVALEAAEALMESERKAKSGKAWNRKRVEAEWPAAKPQAEESDATLSEDSKLIARMRKAVTDYEKEYRRIVAQVDAGEFADKPNVKVLAAYALASARVDLAEAIGDWDEAVAAREFSLTVAAENARLREAEYRAGDLDRVHLIEAIRRRANAEAALAVAKANLQRETVVAESGNRIKKVALAEIEQLERGGE